jgi:predicted nucleic acid-binding protein
VIATILVDTNVFTGRLRKDRVLDGQYAKHTVGWRVVVAPKTVAEARYGALKASWGQRWLTELSDLIEHVRILPVNLQTVEAVADLRNQCRSIVPRRPMIQPGVLRISPRVRFLRIAQVRAIRGGVAGGLSPSDSSRLQPRS